MIIKFLLVLIITQSSVGSFSKNSIVLQENFNIDTFPPNGWRSVVLAGSHNWERRSSNINPPCLPFEGSGMASYPSYAAPEGSKARLITRPINLGRGLYACSLSFYMFHDPGYSDCADRIVVEVSQNLSNFIPIDSILRYRPGASSWIEHKLFLGNFTDSIYLSFLAYSEYGNNMNIDFVRITATKLIAGYDVGIDKITAPLSYHGINTPLIPKAVVKNYGYRVQENFYVVCSIFGADTKHHLYYTDSVLISYLPYNASAFINFSPWLPWECETVTVKIATSLIGDEDTTNNVRIQTTYICNMLNLVFPNGGEFLRGGENYLIRWQFSYVNFNFFKLLFSSDGGVSYPETVAQYIFGGDSFYEWLTPQNSINACLIKILGFDSTGNLWALDISDSNFMIDATNPQAPTLIYPSNRAYINDSFVVFIWSTSYDSGPVSSGIQSYEIEIAHDTNFTNSILLEAPDTIYFLNVPFQDSIYYWHVRAVDNTGNRSVWSEIWCFEIDTRSPGIPLLLAPVDGTWLNDSVIVFFYENSVLRNFSSPLRYLLEIDTTVSFTTPITDTTGNLSDTFILNENKYFWRIQAFDLAGNYSGFSEPDSFGVDYSRPSSPILINPIHNTVLHDSFVCFIWHQSLDNLSGILRYELEIDNDPNFLSAQVYCVTDTVFFIHIVNSDTYYWRVRAIDCANNFSDYSEVRSFCIALLGINELNHNNKLSLQGPLILTPPVCRDNAISLKLYLPEALEVFLDIYNLSGVHICNLLSSKVNAGWHNFSWNLVPGVLSGVYFITFKTPSIRLIRKIIVL